MKLTANGEVDKYRTRLVVKGYKKEYGIDYMKVFASFARHDTYELAGLCSSSRERSYICFNSSIEQTI